MVFLIIVDPSYLMIVTWLGFANRAVHKRLSEHWLINLVVPVAAVADDVDDHVLVEGRTPFRSDVAHVHHCLWIVAVDVEDRRVHDAGHILKYKQDFSG